jgi:hypothetical protein
MWVAHIDIKSLLTKADYNLLENEVVKNALGLVKASFPNEKVGKLIDQFQKDPNSLGITLTDEAYIFMDAFTVGVIFPINDANKLKNNLLDVKLFDEDDLVTENNITAVYAGTSSIAWNKSTLLILSNLPNESEDADKISPIDLLTQKHSESFAATTKYDNLIAAKKDFTYLMSFDGYNKFVQKSMNSYVDGGPYSVEEYSSTTQMLHNMLDIFDTFTGVSMVMTTSFEKGAVKSKHSMYFDTPEAKQAFDDLYGNVTPINGDILKYVGENPLLLVAMNINGTNYVNMLEKFGFMSFLKDKVDFDLVKLLSALNGDAFLALNSVNITDEKFDFLAFATVTNVDELNPEIAKIVAQYLPDAKKLSGGNYLFSDKIYFGIKNSIFYVANDISVVEKIGKDVEHNYYSKKIKGVPAYFYGDLRGLKEPVLAIFESDDKNISMINEGLSLFETYEGRTIDVYSGEFNIYFTNKDKNSLAALCQVIDHAITSYASLLW